MFKYVIGKKKVLKMRIMIRYLGIELVYLKVVIYIGLVILKFIVREVKGKLIIVYNLYRI